MKLTESEWKALCDKTGIKDTARAEQEQDRKKKIDLQILLDVGTVQDRHALEYWKARIKEQKLKEREAARLAKAKTRRTPVRPISFAGNGPARPLRFNSYRPFQVTARLNGLARDCMDRFTFR